MADSNKEVLLGSAADRQTKQRLEDAMRENPAIETLLAKLSASDAQRLGRVMSDPEQIRRMLDSPQGKKLMESMRRGQKPQ